MKSKYLQCLGMSWDETFFSNIYIQKQPHKNGTTIYIGFFCQHRYQNDIGH